MSQNRNRNRVFEPDSGLVSPHQLPGPLLSCRLTGHRFCDPAEHRDDSTVQNCIGIQRTSPHLRRLDPSVPLHHPFPALGVDHSSPLVAF